MNGANGRADSRLAAFISDEAAKRGRRHLSVRTDGKSRRQRSKEKFVMICHNTARI
jgi:hypothetical protein